MIKNPPAKAGDSRDAGLKLRSRRSPGEGNGNPLQYSCLENYMDGGAWWATVHGVTKSQTRFQLHFHFHTPYLGWGSQKIGIIIEITICSLVPILLLFVLTARESVSLSVVSDSVTLWTVVHQALLSLGFSRQQCWNGLPCLPAGNLPDPGIEPRSPALQEDSLPSEPPGKQQEKEIFNLKCWAWIFSL